VAYAIAQKLGADDLNDMTPTGDVTVGDDIFLTAGGVITFASDTNLYRAAADSLKTDDKFTAFQFAEITGAVTASDTQATNGTLTATSYTSSIGAGTACGFTFICPRSGKVKIHYSCEINNTGGYTFFTPRVRTGSTIGSGSDVFAASDDSAGFHNTNIRLGAAVLVISGMTPGTTYNCQLVHRVTAGTGTVGKKHLGLVPIVM
jgi:hypothetical protein